LITVSYIVVGSVKIFERIHREAGGDDWRGKNKVHLKE
jgi:hypothetical protein